jgi:putative addiction module killer protein
MFELLYYQTADNLVPAEKWLDELKDYKGRAIIRARLDRLAHGNAGDHKFVGEGVWEMRISFGPGYRLYYGKDGMSTIILLYGGNKSTQRKDIRRAQGYWSDYRKMK